MTGGRYRAGPWPGLTARGAGVLLGCAVLLGVGIWLVGEPHTPLTGIPPLAMVSLVPLAIATRTLGTPGAASAVCGAYLLPRTLVSLVDPRVPPPPLLLVPAVAFDLAAWVRAADLAALRHAWPTRQTVWRRRQGRLPRVGFWRAVVSGAAFGAILATVEPPFQILLGGDVAAWSGPEVWLAGGLSAVACAVLGPLASARDTGS